MVRVRGRKVAASAALGCSSNAVSVAVRVPDQPLAHRLLVARVFVAKTPPGIMYSSGSTHIQYFTTGEVLAMWNGARCRFTVRCRAPSEPLGLQSSEACHRS